MLNHVQLFPTLWTVAQQAPLSMEFSRRESGIGYHSLLQKDLPNRRIKCMSLAAPALEGGFFTSAPPGKQRSYGWGFNPITLASLQEE